MTPQPDRYLFGRSKERSGLCLNNGLRSNLHVWIPLSPYIYQPISIRASITPRSPAIADCTASQTKLANVRAICGMPRAPKLRDVSKANLHVLLLPKFHGDRWRAP